MKLGKHFDPCMVNHWMRIFRVKYFYKIDAYKGKKYLSCENCLAMELNQSQSWNDPPFDYMVTRVSYVHE